MTVRYIVSLPERALRAVAAALGGLIYEATQVLLPGWLRTSRLYQAVIATMLRIVVEFIGGDSPPGPQANVPHRTLFDPPPAAG